MSYYAFSLMYWTGLRIGGLLALTPKNFDFEKGTISISKSYQRLQGKNIITEPNTPKSNRIIKITDTLCEDIERLLNEHNIRYENSRIKQVSHIKLTLLDMANPPFTM